MTKAQTIQKYMRKLNLSYEDALKMWEDEQADNLPELTTEQKAVEKEMLRADRKVEETPRTRERKPDKDKRLLIAAFMDCLLAAPADDVTITNPEREIEFSYFGVKYRLTLSKPRK